MLAPAVVMVRVPAPVLAMLLPVMEELERVVLPLPPMVRVFEPSVRAPVLTVSVLAELLVHV